MNGMLADVWAEMLHRKGLLIYGITSLFGLVLVAVASSADITFQMNGAEQMPDGIASTLSNPVLAASAFFVNFLVFVTVIATSGLIPRMLEKGRVDFFLSKPIARPVLLWMRGGSILLVYALLITATGLIVYGIGATLAGKFTFGIAAIIAAELVAFFVWNSIAMLVGVLSGSQAMAMMTIFVIWIMQTIFQAHEQIAQYFAKYEIVGAAAHLIYWVLPKTSQLSELGKEIALGMSIATWAPLYTALPFGLLAMVVAGLLFARKDY